MSKQSLHVSAFVRADINILFRLSLVRGDLILELRNLLTRISQRIDLPIE